MMLLSGRHAVIAALLLVGNPAYAACLPTEEIEARLGAGIRSGAPNLEVGDLAGRPLCSGLTLAQQIQRIRASAEQEQAAAARAAAPKPKRR